MDRVTVPSDNGPRMRAQVHGTSAAWKEYASSLEELLARTIMAQANGEHISPLDQLRSFEILERRRRYRPMPATIKLLRRQARRTRSST